MCEFPTPSSLVKTSISCVVNACNSQCFPHLLFIKEQHCMFAKAEISYFHTQGRTGSTFMLLT